MLSITYNRNGITNGITLDQAATIARSHRFDGVYLDYMGMREWIGIVRDERSPYINVSIQGDYNEVCAALVYISLTGLESTPDNALFLAQMQLGLPIPMSGNKEDRKAWDQYQEDLSMPVEA